MYFDNINYLNEKHSFDQKQAHFTSMGHLGNLFKKKINV